MKRRRALNRRYGRSSDADKRKLVELAIGRIFRLASRPERPGDAAEYERCRAIILDAVDPAMVHAASIDRRPNWVRDRLKGAAGD